MITTAQPTHLMVDASSQGNFPVRMQLTTNQFKRANGGDTRAQYRICQKYSGTVHAEHGVVFTRAIRWSDLRLEPVVAQQSLAI